MLGGSNHELLVAQHADASVGSRQRSAIRAGIEVLRTILRTRTRLFLTFLVCEALAFAVIPAAARTSSAAALTLGQVGIALAFLVGALYLRQNATANELWPVFYAFFVAAAAVAVSIVLSGYLRGLLGYGLDTAPGIALAKFSQSVLRVLPILLLIGLAGDDRRSLYLNRGRLGLGLVVGAAAFVVFGALAFAPLAGNEAAVQKVVSWAPWILVFIFANAMEEELLFRGLFLRRFEPFLGRGLANLLTAIVFTLIHVQATYAADMIQFLAVVFPLGLAFGYLMQKTDSLWGSVAFHAGADLLIIVGIFGGL